MRHTSLDAWSDIKRSGILGAEQLKAYACLFRYGPLTGRELDEELGPDMHKRLSELERYGVVVCNEKRKCKITGRMVHEWDVTPERAVKPPPAAKKKRSKPLLELLIEACRALEATGDLFAVAKAKEIRAAVRGDQ